MRIQSRTCVVAPSRFERGKERENDNSTGTSLASVNIHKQFHSVSLNVHFSSSSCSSCLPLALS